MKRERVGDASHILRSQGAVKINPRDFPIPAICGVGGEGESIRKEGRVRE